MKRARPLLATAAALLAAGCSGIQELDPIDPYEGGEEVTAVGVLHKASTQSGDFVPGRLRVQMGFPIGTAQLESALGAAVTGIEATALEGDPGTLWSLEIPPGTSLVGAERRVAAVQGVAGTGVEMQEGSSGGASLVSTGSGGFVHTLARKALLVIDPDLLNRHREGEVVRVRGRLRAQSSALGADTTLRVDEVETMHRYSVGVEGVFRVSTGALACVYLEPQDGPAAELVGSMAGDMATDGSLRNQVVVVTGRDVGLSVDSCAGGRRLMVDAFERR